MRLACVDIERAQDDETGEYHAIVHVCVQDIGIFDAAALSDALEKRTVEFVEQADVLERTSKPSS